MEEEIIESVRQKAFCCGKRMREDMVGINGTIANNFVCMKCGYSIRVEQEIFDDVFPDTACALCNGKLNRAFEKTGVCLHCSDLLLDAQGMAQEFQAREAC